MPLHATARFSPPPRALSAQAIPALILLAILALLARSLLPALIDDAYITLVYARNLALHAHWGFYPDAPLNTATSPLNVVLLAALTRLAGNAQRAAAVAAVIEWAGIVWALERIRRRWFGSHWLTFAAGAAIIANPLLVSTLGLESLLYAWLLLLATGDFIARRWMPLAIALALLELTRVDAVLMFFLCLPFVPGWPRRLRFAALYAAIVLPWHLFAWIHLGSFFPETLFIKTAQKTFGAYGFWSGPWLYLRRFPWPALASVALLPGCFAMLSHVRPPLRRAFAAAAVPALLHYAAYSALRVPPYHWYYAPEIAGLTLAGAMALASIERRARLRRNPALVGALWLLPFIPIAALATCYARAGAPTLAEMPIHTNWATPAEYRQIAADLCTEAAPAGRIEVHGEIGTLAYYCDDKIHLIDEFSDAATLMNLIRDVLKPHGLKQLFVELNFLWQPPPPGSPEPRTMLEWLPASPAAAASLREWPVRSHWLGAGQLVWRPIEPPLPRPVHPG